MIDFLGFLDKKFYVCLDKVPQGAKRVGIKGFPLGSSFINKGYRPNKIWKILYQNIDR